MTETSELYRGTILLSLRMRCSLAKVCDPFNLTPVQGMVLIMLEPEQSMTMNKLTCMLGCDASNTTGLVDRLESQDMITRSKDPSDKRVSMISLSDNGVNTREELLKELSHKDKLNLGSLSEEQHSVMKTIMTVCHHG